MADSEMTEHISAPKMELFSARGLPEHELATAARHLANCSDCHQQFVATLRRHREVADLSFTLAPGFWLRHHHVDYEQVVALADNKLDAADREVIDVHLTVCPPCREDVRSFLAFREQITPELENSSAPVTPPQRRPASPSVSTWWGGLAWRPIYAAAVIVIGIAIVIGSVLLLKRRAENLEAKQAPTPQLSPSSTPDDRAANLISPPSTPNESPIEESNSGEAIVVLNDRRGTITVDKSGNLAGLNDVPSQVRDQIAKALTSERIERPAVLTELAGQESALRGSYKLPFKLIAPARTVIESNRPTFRWERIQSASSYRVYVNEPGGQEVARSEELASDRTAWTVTEPLKRGGIYTWTVVAVVDGKEIVSPGPAAPEMRFRILSGRDVRELEQLKRTNSHLVLGMIYANAGMMNEAGLEFRKLIELNPKSAIPKKLLRSSQSAAPKP